ncbi:FAD binding domain-containing protein [Schinkia azotoformans]|uniref:FAD binding domain-containing protein n=1 Tax=Schinkia azotoformans TaxID=1454 RepID=UPI002DBB6313|nr:FAD binding domain-containing protein [Schinkia azotoformans]MEC1717049.1 FAD binding domain-containing protein [Schinkia azotoformans]MEC1741863.1 FAD binding domain-containing protein [Schinkia azotoformans]MEC1747456.1 FAD binding domain-containing protein [Schinkia azotoformans]MEC1758105.1 FAD binding domain-containing protein [Schinkia azotoformans]MEC1766495.1 FAD binding domain-containing protein [Schinkia azotoformans]
MLTGNIEYYKPATMKEAVELFFALKEKNKQPLYYSGGTEILTLGRLNRIEAKSFIDIKGIVECHIFEFKNDSLITGVALPLTFIEEKNSFPLLSQTSMGIADHTARNKITLGGNLCGKIYYREAVLPFLLCESKVIVLGNDGVKAIPIREIFHRSFQLQEGQFLIQLHTEKKYINLPFKSIKIRQQWETGYPLITIAAIKVENEFRFAYSGLCRFPFRSKEMEEAINQSGLQLEERIAMGLEYLPAPVLDDIEGSKEYRLFVLKNTLRKIIMEMEGK